MSPPTPSTESALLLVVPAAEPAVARHRIEYDPAARVGVPAHVTVAYPFKPVELLDDSDISVLVELWQGPPLADATPGWHLVRSFALGG